MPDELSSVGDVRLQSDGNSEKSLVASSFTPSGETKNLSDDLSLVVQSAQAARDFLLNKQ